MKSYNVREFGEPVERAPVTTEFGSAAVCFDAPDGIAWGALSYAE